MHQSIGMGRRDLQRSCRLRRASERDTEHGQTFGDGREAECFDVRADLIDQRDERVC